jgi:hypothetical protein
MGKLKPIGSEKLEGTQKVSRIMEIARYNEHIPTPINENNNVEYQITLVDGKNYQIVKEKNGYVIKRGLNESIDSVEYLEPIKNRKYYPSYSQAFKRLNLIVKEINSSSGYDKNISLFNEEASNEAKKYILKINANEQAPTPADLPPAEPAAEPAPQPTDVVQPEPAVDVEPVDIEDEGDDEVVTFNTIQKLTGKLGQKIREFLSNEENKMSSKDIKYVVNSVLSSLDLNGLEDTDKEEIVSKFEVGDSTMEIGTEDMSTSEIQPEPLVPSEPVSPEGEMGEDFEMGDVKKTLSDIFSEESDMDDEMGKPTIKKPKYEGMSDDHYSKMEEMIENMFTESKVDKIIKKYFKIDEKEKFLNEEREKKKLLENKIIIKTNNRIKSLSESISQEVSSKKLFKKYPESKFLGKTNKNNLVFEINNKMVSVTPTGNVK